MSVTEPRGVAAARMGWRARRVLLAALLPAVCVAAPAACSVKHSNRGCKKQADCDPGEICVDRRCESDPDATTTSGSGGAGGGPTTSTSTPSTSTTTTGSTSSTGPSPTGWVARVCTSDADCGASPGARCAKSTDNEPVLQVNNQQVGGPAGGYCTKNCLEHSDCPSDAACITQGGNGRCMAECTFGVPKLMSLDEEHPANKCHGRDDLMCTAFDGASACIPICGSDSECGGGRGCSLQSGVCVDKPKSGSKLGAKCLPDNESTPQNEDGCAGFCLTFIDEQNKPESHMCSAYCALGGPLATTQNCGGPLEGICVFGPVVNGKSSENGDLGFCTGACTQHDGCNYAEGHFCFDVGLLGELGVGYCFGVTKCPNGNECDADQMCVQTKYGKVCVEKDPAKPGQPLFPLGGAAP